MEEIVDNQPPDCRNPDDENCDNGHLIIDENAGSFKDLEDMDEEEEEDFQEMEGIDVTEFFNIQQDDGTGVYNSLDGESYNINELPTTCVKEESNEQNWHEYSNVADSRQLPFTADIKCESCSSWIGNVDVKEEKEESFAMGENFQDLNYEVDQSGGKLQPVLSIPKAVTSPLYTETMPPQPFMTTASMHHSVNAMGQNFPGLNNRVDHSGGKLQPVLSIPRAVTSLSYSRTMQPQPLMTTGSMQYSVNAMGQNFQELNNEVDQSGCKLQPVLSIPSSGTSLIYSGTVPPQPLLTNASMHHSGNVLCAARSVSEPSAPTLPSFVMVPTLPTIMSAPTLPTVTQASNRPSMMTVSTVPTRTYVSTYLPNMGNVQSLPLMRMASKLPSRTGTFTSPSLNMPSSVSNFARTTSVPADRNSSTNLKSLPMIVAARNTSQGGHIEYIPLYATKTPAGVGKDLQIRFDLQMARAQKTNNTGIVRNNIQSVPDFGAIRLGGNVANIENISSETLKMVGNAIINNSGIQKKAASMDNTICVSLGPRTLSCQKTDVTNISHKTDVIKISQKFDVTEIIQSAVIPVSKPGGNSVQVLSSTAAKSKDEPSGKQPFQFTTLAPPETLLASDLEATTTQPATTTESPVNQSDQNISLDGSSVPDNSHDFATPKFQLSKIKQDENVGENGNQTTDIYGTPNNILIGSKLNFKLERSLFAGNSDLLIGDMTNIKDSWCESSANNKSTNVKKSPELLVKTLLPDFPTNNIEAIYKAPQSSCDPTELEKSSPKVHFTRKTKREGRALLTEKLPDDVSNSKARAICIASQSSHQPIDSEESLAKVHCTRKAKREGRALFVSGSAESTESLVRRFPKSRAPPFRKSPKLKAPPIRQTPKTTVPPDRQSPEPSALPVRQPSKPAAHPVGFMPEPTAPQVGQYSESTAPPARQSPEPKDDSQPPESTATPGGQSPESTGPPNKKQKLELADKTELGQNSQIINDSKYFLPSLEKSIGIRPRRPHANLTPTPPNMLQLLVPLPGATSARYPFKPTGPASLVAAKLATELQEFAKDIPTEETITKNSSTEATQPDNLAMDKVKTITKNIVCSVNGSDDSMCMNTHCMPRSQLLLVHHSVDHNTDSAVLCCCRHCDFWCVSATGLCTHWHVFTKHGLTKCFMCQILFKTQEQLNQHFLSDHPAVAKKHTRRDSYSYTTRPLGTLTKLQTTSAIFSGTNITKMFVDHDTAACKLLLFTCIECGYKHPEYEIAKLHAYDHLKQKFFDLGMSPSEKPYFDQLLSPEIEGMKYILPENLVLDINSCIAPVEYVVHVYYETSKIPYSLKCPKGQGRTEMLNSVAVDENDILLASTKHIGLKEVLNQSEGDWDVYVDAVIIRKTHWKELLPNSDPAVDLCIQDRPRITDIMNGCQHLRMDWQSRILVTNHPVAKLGDNGKRAGGPCCLYLCNLCSFLCCSQNEICILGHMRSVHYWPVDECSKVTSKECMQALMQNGVALLNFAKMLSYNAFYSKVNIEKCKLKLYLCENCTFSHPLLTNMQNHVLLVHSQCAGNEGKNFTFSCKLCSFVHYYRDQLAQHLLEKHAGCDLRNHAADCNMTSNDTLFGIQVVETVFKCDCKSVLIKNDTEKSTIYLRQARIRGHTVLDYESHQPPVLAQIKMVTFDHSYLYKRTQDISAEQARSKPTTSKPTTSEPTTSEPTSSKPTISKPTTSKPTTSEPTSSKPTISKPTTSKPTTSEPTSSKPTISKPTTSKPTTSEQHKLVLAETVVKNLTTTTEPNLLKAKPQKVASHQGLPYWKEIDRKEIFILPANSKPAMGPCENVSKISKRSAEPKIATWQAPNKASNPFDLGPHGTVVQPDSSSRKDVCENPGKGYKVTDPNKFPEGLKSVCSDLHFNHTNNTVTLPPVNHRRSQVDLCYIFTCKICQFWCIGRSKTCVMEHVRETHIRHHCKFCAITFPSYLDLEDHMELTHSHKQSQSENLVKNTAQYMHGCVDMKQFGILPKSYLLHRCSECNAVFPSLLLVDYHVLLEHFGQDMMWTCPICQSAFSNEVILKSHMKEKHPFQRDNATMSQLLKASPFHVAKLSAGHSQWVQSVYFQFS